MTGQLTPEQVDREYDHIFGISTRREYEDGLHDHAFGTTHLSTAKRASSNAAGFASRLTSGGRRITPGSIPAAARR